MKLSKKNDRIYYFELLRVIGCLAVVMIHSSANYVVKNLGSFNFWVGNFFDSISRIGVPLFVMISGALLLDEKYEFTVKKLVKHIKKLIIFFIFWSTFYAFVFYLIDPIVFKNVPVNKHNLVYAFIKGHYHLWFIYMIIGLYLILPLLRLWVNKTNKRYVEYFLILAFIISSFLPEVISIGSRSINELSVFKVVLEQKLFLQYVCGYTSLFVLGWYLHNYPFKNYKTIYSLGLLGLAVTFIGTSVLSILSGKQTNLYGDLTVNVIAQTIAIFVLIQYLFKDKITNGNKFVASVSKYSLGIYGVHVFFMTILIRLFNKFSFDNALVNIPIVFVISFIISYFVSYIFGKIKCLKNVV